MKIEERFDLVNGEPVIDVLLLYVLLLWRKKKKGIVARFSEVSANSKGSKKWIENFTFHVFHLNSKKNFVLIFQRNTSRAWLHKPIRILN